jgi:sirohydrochlorin cobaltochelatase
VAQTSCLWGRRASRLPKTPKAFGVESVPTCIEKLLKAASTTPFCFGQTLIQKTNDGFVVSHREDEGRNDLETCRNAEDAVEIAKYDDAGNFRPLKTAPNLRHGWRLVLKTLDEVKRALDYFYPGRLAVFAAWKAGQLSATSLRETLERQSGMYRVAAKISDKQVDDLVGDFCRSDSGCLRTILWKRDQSGAIASTKLPKEKFDPARDQAEVPSGPESGSAMPATVPLLCQEPCNLLVAECRKVVTGTRPR